MIETFAYLIIAGSAKQTGYKITYWYCIELSSIITAGQAPAWLSTHI